MIVSKDDIFIVDSFGLGSCKILQNLQQLSR